MFTIYFRVQFVDVLMPYIHMHVVDICVNHLHTVFVDVLRIYLPIQFHYLSSLDKSN
jgi:hypothetical protein